MNLRVTIIMSILFSAILITSSCKHEPDILPAQSTQSGSVNGTGNNGGGGNGGGGTGYINTCDSDTVYFQNTILPLFVSNCAMSNCHNATSHRDGIILDSYSNIIGTGHIQPYNVNYGHIYQAITTTSDEDRMPPSPSPALTSTQINQIATWINQGALNNYCFCGCDTVNVTFSGTIQPVLQNNCVGCHNNTSPGGNVILSAYSGVQAVALNGHLLGSVNHGAGYSPMPKNLAKLPDCEIAEIRIWIQNGAPNN